MTTGSSLSPRGRIGTLRRLPLLAAAASIAAMVSSCAGNGAFSPSQAIVGIVFPEKGPAP